MVCISHEEGTMKFESLSNALTFAAEKEDASYRLYTSFRDLVQNETARQLLEKLAAQELNHKELLKNALTTGHIDFVWGKKEISEIDFGDYTSGNTAGPGSTPQDILQCAVKMAQEAHDLYADLLANYADTDLEPLLMRLAREELQHMAIVEDQYERHIAQWL